MLKSADLGALAREFEARFGDIPDFFDHDALVVDLSRLESAAQGGERQAVDFPGLLELLWKYRLAPVAVHGARNDLAAVAKAAGLFFRRRMRASALRRRLALPMQKLLCKRPQCHRRRSGRW